MQALSQPCGPAATRAVAVHVCAMVGRTCMVGKLDWAKDHRPIIFDTLSMFDN